MRALIYELEGAVGAGTRDLAGRSVLVRQLQWLRDLGIEDVVVEIVDGPDAVARGDLVLGDDPLVARVIAVPTASPVGVETLADRAGIDETEVFLALPADIVAHARFELPSRVSRHRVAPPSFAAQERPVELVFRTRHQAPGSEAIGQVGWALSVRDEAIAHTLACEALLGRAEGLLVHGAEIKPGVWYARGARVAEDATLIAPTLIGAGARVFARARLGPSVLLGANALIERDAVLSDVTIAPDTLVGEGARIRQAFVDACGMTSFADGTHAPVDDPLVLTRVHGSEVPTAPRIAGGALLLTLLIPWFVVLLLGLVVGRRPVRTLRWNGVTLHVGALGLAIIDLVPALYDVVRGTRDLVGIAPGLPLDDLVTPPFPSARAGALDIAPALAPGSGHSTLRAMWAWYLRNKQPQLDRALLLSRIRGPRT